MTASAALSNLYRFAPDFHNKCQKMQLDLCIVYTQEANSGNAELGVRELKKSAAPSHCKQLTGCVIVFEIFRRNGDCTFYVAVKIGGQLKKMMGLAAISFDKAFRV
jgi:hypothetical protein